MFEEKKMKCKNCGHKIHRTEYGEWYHEDRHHNYCKCVIAEATYCKHIWERHPYASVNFCMICGKFKGSRKK
jgi:hypothetical protein